MKTVKYRSRSGKSWGIFDQGKIFALEGNLYGEFHKRKEICRLEDAGLLAPVEPTILVRCGMNYAEHFKEDYSSHLRLKPTA